jgi:hypothetical protein
VPPRGEQQRGPPSASQARARPAAGWPCSDSRRPLDGAQACAQDPPSNPCKASHRGNATDTPKPLAPGYSFAAATPGPAHPRASDRHRPFLSRTCFRCDAGLGSTSIQTARTRSTQARGGPDSGARIWAQAEAQRGRRRRILSIDSERPTQGPEMTKASVDLIMLTLGCAANRSSDGGRLKAQSRRPVGADLVAASGDDQPPRRRPSRGWVSGKAAVSTATALAAPFTR